MSQTSTNIEQSNNLSTLLDSMSPNDFFEKYEKRNMFLETVDMRQALNDYFEQHYQNILDIAEINYSTNHVHYTIYYNEKKNDIRILMNMSGCFYSSQKFISIEIVEQRLEDLKNLIKEYKGNIHIDTSFYTAQFPPLQKLIKTYYSLVNNEEEIIE